MRELKLLSSTFLKISFVYIIFPGYKFAIMEMKAAISSIIREYHLSLVAGKEDIEFSYRITIRCKGGVWIGFNKRTRRESTTLD